MTAAALADDTVVALHPLHIGPDEGGEREVGRPDTGVFVALPAEGVDLVGWLGDGLPLGEVRRRFADRYGEAPDLGEFVAALAECGFVRTGAEGDPTAPERPRGLTLFAALPPERVRWLVSRPVRYASRLLWLAVPVLLVGWPVTRPHPADALVTDRVLANAVLVAAVAWTLVLAHECVHALTVRALGCTGRLSISRRMWFLVGQTEMTGLRAVPRQRRYAAYLSGMTWDMLLLTGCFAVEIGGHGDRLVRATAYTLLLSLLFQFSVFLRTDVYFALANWLRLGDLRGDTRRWLANQRRRVLRRPPAHDLSAVPARELRVIRWYAPYHVLGSTLVTAGFALLAVPALVRMLRIAAEGVAGGPRHAACWDGLGFLALIALQFGTLAVLAIADRARERTCRPMMPRMPLAAVVLAVLGTLALAAPPPSSAPAGFAGARPVLLVLRSGAAAPAGLPVGAHRYRLGGLVAASVTPAEALRLGRDPGVAALLPDRTVRLRTPTASTPDDTAAAPVCPLDPGRPLLEPEGLGLTRTESAAGAPAAHDLATGRGVTVGILGGSLDTALPDLTRGGRPVVTRYRDFTGEGTAAPSYNLESFGDASTIAAQGAVVHDLSGYVNPAHPLPAGCTVRIRGVAPGADLAVAKVFSSTAAPVSVILRAIDWAVHDAHVDVLNESLFAEPYPDTGADALRLANDAAVAAGVTVVVASGDAGPDTLGSPASDPAVLAVGATTQLRAYAQRGAGGYPAGARGWVSGGVAAFSAGGTAQREPRTVDLVAPGDAGWIACSPDTVAYRSCATFDNGFTPSTVQVFSGTSEAAPFVAGAAALVVEAYTSAHHGTRPSPALVKQILLGSARDLGAPAAEQGAGEVDTLAAVRLAGAKEGLRVAPAALTVTGRAGGRLPAAVTVSNAGPVARQVRPVLRTWGGDRTIAEGDLALGPGDAVFADSDGTPATYRRVPFRVGPGTDLLTWAIGWPTTPGGSVVRVTLLDPDGRMAGYSEPLFASAGYGRVTVPRPPPGEWTAVVWTRQDSSAHAGPVHYTATAGVARERPAGPAVTVPAGGAARVPVTLEVPATAGDSTASLLLGAGGPAVPVGLRALASGHFHGVLTGGNGLLVAAGIAGGQTGTYQFDVPPGWDGVAVTLRTGDPGYPLLAYLVDPSGMALATATGPGELRVARRDPVPGRWTLVVVLNGTVTSGKTSQPVEGEITAGTVPVIATGLPHGTVAAGHPITVRLSVTNPGPGPLTVFADPRRAGTVTVPLVPVNPAGYTVPDTLLADYPRFLVPPHTSRLAVSANAAVPLALDTQPYTGGGYTIGDPDVPARPGRHPTAVVESAALTPTTWVCDANPAGPFGAVGLPPTPVTCAATARTAPFDPDATSSTGTIWSGPFQPLSLAPGASGELVVTITPSGRPGTVVHGFLGLDTWDPTAQAASELRDLRYTYTIGPGGGVGGHGVG